MEKEKFEKAWNDILKQEGEVVIELDNTATMIADKYVMKEINKKYNVIFSLHNYQIGQVMLKNIKDVL